ncbi:hypothetical protein [Membranihabitans maritimus]|uniref:hypothetical protein n=1 Tax=Membranihabitans maritimus TaxID=2904244 RepID=UPI001F2835CE|nr:hypothetical protein [Membranihabitans maritimus]
MLSLKEYESAIIKILKKSSRGLFRDTIKDRLIHYMKDRHDLEKDVVTNNFDFVFNSLKAKKVIIKAHSKPSFSDFYILN